MPASDTSARFYTRRQIAQLAWADLRQPGVYGKLLVVGLLPLMIRMVFSVLALAGGAAEGFKAHHLERLTDFSTNLSDRLLWVSMRELTTGLVLLIGLYAAILVVRGQDFNVMGLVGRALSWRYLLGAIMLYLAIFALAILAGVAGVAVIGLALFTRGNAWLSASFVFSGIAVSMGLWLLIYLQYSPLFLLFQDKLLRDEDWNLFGLLRESRRFMSGCKFDLLQQLLPLIPLLFLETITLGIGNVFLDPYLNLVVARFYDNRQRFEALERTVMQSAPLTE